MFLYVKVGISNHLMVHCTQVVQYAFQIIVLFLIIAVIVHNLAKQENNKAERIF